MRMNATLLCLALLPGLSAGAAAPGPLQREGYRLTEMHQAPLRRDWQKEAQSAVASCNAVPSAPTLKPGELHITKLVKDRFFNKFFQGGGKLYRLVAQQKGIPMAVVIDSGIWSLPQLKAALASQSGALTQSGKAWLLRLPLLIHQGAGLELREGETLRLSRNQGVFLISMGTLYLQKAQLQSWDEEKNAAAVVDASDGSSFQPFVLGWSGSLSVFRDSSISGLGFSENLAQGLSFAVGPQGLDGYTLPAPPRVYLSGNHLDSLYTGVHASGIADVRVCNNEFTTSRANAVHFDGGSSGIISANHITDTQGAYAIFLNRGARDTLIVRNDVSENHRSGIAISDGVNITLAGNQIRQNFDAVFLQASERILMADNQIVDNQRHGISLRNVGLVRFQDEHIGPNRGVGIIAQRAKPATAAEADDSGSGSGSTAAAGVVEHRHPAFHRLEMLGIALEGNHSSALVIEAPYSVIMDRTEVSYPGVRRRPVFRGVLNSFESDILKRMTKKKTVQVVPLASAS